MKKSVLVLGAAVMMSFMVSCGGGQKAENATAETKTEVTEDEGKISLFNGKDFTGWRGYNRQDVPARWTIEDGCIKFNGSGGGEAQSNDGGDIIFDKKFKNFELELEWKVSKGGNSGIFYLAQEVPGKPIYISAPEFRYWIMKTIRMRNWVKMETANLLLCMI
jgi:hypothetical protein